MSNVAIDFDKAIADAKKDLDNRLLRALILGPSGAGKSALIGTLKGKTLYLYASAESHGPSTAQDFGGDIVPICVDRIGDRKLTANEAFERLLGFLKSKEKIKELGIANVAIDSATEVEMIIRQTDKWKQLCMTDKGKHNGFAEHASTLLMFRPIFDALRDLQLELDIHYVMTCILDVKQIGDNGEILESSPRLAGYAVAEGLCQQLEYFVVGRMTKGDKTAHRIQFMAGVSKESKDAVGRIKKTINFNPRLFGAKELPATMEADLSKIVELKANGGK